MTPRESTAAGYFGSMAEEYDSLIRRAVPRYDEMTSRLIDYLPPAPASALELGCGTGNLSLALTAYAPECAFTFVDAAPEMVALTQARLKAACPETEGRASFLAIRFEDLAPAPETFDLVTSSISLHHVRDKGTFYKVIRKALKPGGTFRFADQLLGGSDANHELNWLRWLEFCRSPEHCSEEEIRSLLDHAAAHDHYTPLEQQFRFLREAGFVHLDCVWRNWMWGVITADAELPS